MTAIAPAMLIVGCECTTTEDGELLTGVVRSACGNNHPPYNIQRASDDDCRRILAAVNELGGQWRTWKSAP